MPKTSVRALPILVAERRGTTKLGHLALEFRVLFDISRLLARANRPAPTGIDRVEMAYAKHLIATIPDRLNFTAVTSWGRIGPLPRQGAMQLIELIARRWHGAARQEPAIVTQIASLAQRLQIQLVLGGERALTRREHPQGSDTIYLLTSHHHLERAKLLRQLKERTGCRFICLVHDLIPIEYPEYARAGQAAQHFRRMETAATLADAVITNSVHTATAFGRVVKAIGRDLPVLAAPLGIDLHHNPTSEPSPQQARRPYFVCVATIEPKKNHLLLLNVWRRLALVHGAATPRLILVGQRGWENENVIDMIERSMPLRGLIEEHSALPDGAMRQLLLEARALLLPSFAEGYGLPVVEALALGVPVICSDLPSLREATGNVPDYLDPLDGPAWAAAVMDYTTPGSLRRQAQLSRLASWPVPEWDAHFARVFDLLHQIGNGAVPVPLAHPAVAAGR